MQGDQRFVISGAMMIDGIRDVAVEDEVVVVEEGRVSAVGRADSPGVRPLLQGAKILDGGGMTLLPGLIDCHVHLCMRGVYGPALVLEPPGTTALNAAFNAQRQLIHGVTTVRDVGGQHFVDIALRDAIAGGDIVGPRVIASGHYIAMTGGHGYLTARQADGVAEVTKATREQIRAGADWIKLMASGGQLRRDENPTDPELSAEELRAAITEARNHNKPVAVHEHGSTNLLQTLLAGVSTVEHGTYLSDEVIAVMAERGIALCPTFLPYSLQANNTSGRQPPWRVARAKKLWEDKLANFQRALQGGVRVVAGSDSCLTVSHGEGVREIAWLAEAGMTPIEAIKAATSVAADVLLLGDVIGRIKEGLAADLILVKGNPLEDLSTLASPPHMVMQAGRVLTWDDWTDML
ncbi:MAG: amidohydrolase family protein [Candidatus Bipolaricaulota bacterium]